MQFFSDKKIYICTLNFSYGLNMKNKQNLHQNSPSSPVKVSVVLNNSLMNQN